nr:MAG TPA: hypothetical protein [Caudoviricetes sp.]
MKNVSIDCEFITIDELREKCENGLKSKLTSSELEKMDNYKTATCLCIPLEDECLEHSEDDSAEDKLKLLIVSGSKDNTTFQSISNGLRGFKSIISNIYPDNENTLLHIMINYSYLFDYIESISKEDIKIMLNLLYDNYNTRLVLI